MMKKLLFTFLIGLLSLALEAQVTSFPWAEDFESENQCGTFCGASCTLQGELSNVFGDDIDWTADAFGTGSSSTGPTANGGADHNPGTSGGRYVYTEASGCSNDAAHLESPVFDFTNVGTPVLTFWYHMYGSSMGTMHFDIDTSGVGAWDLDYIPSWTDDLDQWQEQTVDLSEFSGMNNFKFRVRGITGFSFRSDMAVDDFELINAEFNVGLIDGNLTPCFNDSTGFLTVEAFFGALPYSYAWSTGDTGVSITNLPPGTYTVTATDVNGDTTSSTFNLLATDSIFANPTITVPLVCKYDEAVVSVNGSGGEAYPDAYTMDTNSANYNPDTTGGGTLVNLSDDQVSPDINIGFDFEFFDETYTTFRISSNGFMTFENTFNSGCCSGQSFPQATAPNAVIALCWDDLYPPGNGQISYYTVGTAPFRTLIVNFENIPYCCNSIPSVSVQAKLFETTNCIQIHTVDVVNANPATQGIENETGTEGFTYPGRNASAWSSQETFVEFCPLDSTGLLYAWSDGTLGQVNSGLSAGTYTVTISDGAGCSIEESVVLNPAPSNLTLDPIIADVSCFGAGDGSILSNESGGVAPVTYNWSSGQNSADITGLSGGSYSVVATDQLGCVDSASNLMIEEATILVAAINSQSFPNCPDDATGSAGVVAGGGRTPYTYAWSDGQLTQVATNLVEGTYAVTVTDSSGCNSVQTVNIIAENEAPMVDLGVNYQSTTGIGVTLDAGNYAQHQWSTGETTQTIHVTETGDYWAVATNGAGCSGSDTVYVEIWPNGMNEVEGSSMLTLFPNPAKDQLTLTLNGTHTLKDVRINVIDIQGRVVMQEQFQRIGSNAPVSIDLISLTPGTYNLSVTSNDVNINRVFIKQ